MKSLQRGSIFALCFGLRFGERESGAEAERRQERSRSETTVAVPQAEARRTFSAVRMPLVTSARICVVERASSKGNRATGSPWSEANRALVTAVKFFGWTGFVPGCGADSPCEQLGMDGGGRWGSVSAADERTQQPHFAH